MKTVTRTLQVLLVFLLLLPVFQSRAATITVGNGTVSCNYPYATYWGGARAQFLYTAAQLSAAGATAGTISTMGFNITSYSTQVMNSFYIRMGNTALTSISSWTGGLTQCYFGSYAVPGTGWQVITLQTPFLWNGTSNLILEVCYDNGYSYTSYTYINGTTAPTGQIYPYWMDGSGGCAYTGSGYTGYTGLPNIQFNLTPLVTGNLTGTVRNCFNNAVLAGVSVSCGGIGPVVTNASGVYTLNGINAGQQTITATFGGFSPYSNPVNVVGNTTTTFNFCMNPIPGILSGVVTNCANGNPVVGAKISFGANSTYSVIGGAYSLNVYPGGTQNVQATKEGFATFSQSNVTVTPPSTTTLNICMNEATNPPSTPFTAVLNTGQTAVNLNWGLPIGDMVLLYDDGIQDNFAIWATGGGNNMNAMKFTPISYPAVVKKFYLNIGTAANYPSGNAFSPVDMAIYNEVGGVPGTQLAAPQTIVPAVYGWTEYTFDTPITIPSGNFFIVMIQTGTSLVSPGVAIDTTIQQLRSYSKFGSTPWVPGPGNFMIRAVVSGSGGPLLTDNQNATPITASVVPGLIYEYTPATVTGVEGPPVVYPEMGLSPDNLLGYQVWRLTQGQEATPALWTSVGTPTATNLTDNSWPSLPCGPYRWAAEAQYTFNRWSNATFSTVIGKCWTCSLTVNIALSCDSADVAGAIVTLHNLDAVDTVYTHLMTSTGTYTFANFWKGHYNLTVTKFGYTNYAQTPIDIFGDMTINVTLLQIKSAPTNLVVPDSTLHATWNPPTYQIVLLNEPFTSGSFATNSWVVDAGSNWGISAADGNPGYCAEFYWYPEIFNYDFSITSKLLTGVSAPVMNLKYDIHLDNFSTATMEQLAVEIWDGTTWHLVKNYDNSAGSIPYTSESINIAAYGNSSFKIRFRAYGSDSFNINWWDIDNVQVICSAVETNPNPCIIGYNFYLNGINSGFTQDTFYDIPPSYVVYGTFYHACVLAVYGSGYSATSCYDFTAHFLCPPNTVTGIPIECNAFLTWQKPNCGGCTLANYTYDAGPPYGNALSINPGFQIQDGNLFPVTPATTSGVIKSFDIWFSQYSTWTTQSCILYIYDAAYNVIGQSAAFQNGPAAAWPSGTWINVPIADVPYTGPFYGMVDYYTTTVPKNGMGLDVVTPQPGNPQGLAYGYYLGAFTPATILYGYPAPQTFAIRANVCVNGKDKDAPIVTIDPSKLPVQKTVTPVPQAAVNCGPNVDVPAGQSITPTSPDAPTAITLTGYRIFRNDVKIADVAGPNTLEYYDYNLDPGTYNYTVEAMYDVTPFTPSPDNSQPAGPVTVLASCGYHLPFFEPWNGGSFGYQNWTFAPNQGNWSFNTAIGDPTPCADFSWDPITTNYDQSLVTPTIDATEWTCADIYADFDVKLIDRYAPGTEKLDIDVLVNGAWQNKMTLSDSGSYDWTLKHVTISSVMGKGFKLRFRAHGPTTENILHWYVDNILIYGVCRPATSLQGHQNEFITNLTWHTPDCPTACTMKNYTYDNGGPYWNALSINPGYNIYQGNYFPFTATASGVIKSFDVWFTQYSSWTTQSCVLYLFDAAQNPIGQSAAFMNGPAATWPSGTWINIPIDDIPYTGPFYALIDYTTSSVPKNGMGWDDVTIIPGQPDGLAWGWMDGVFTPADQLFGYPAPETYSERVNVCESSSKDKDAPIVSIDPSKIKHGTFVSGAATPPTGPQPAGWKNTNPNNDSQQGTIVDLPKGPTGSQLMGYNVYRTPEGNPSGNFSKINPAPVSDTTYADDHGSSTPLLSSWKYYVTVVFHDSLDADPNSILCEPHSDTILINFPAVGINNLGNNSISLYPNPANDLVYVVSTNDIKTLEILNYIGQTVYTNNNVNLKKAELNVSSFKAGVYFVKVTTNTGTKTTKITVTH